MHKYLHIDSKTGAFALPSEKTVPRILTLDERERANNEPEWCELHREARDGHHSPEPLAEVAKRLNRCRADYSLLSVPKEAAVKDVWLVNDEAVCEPYLGGMQLGTVDELDMDQFNVTRRLSQDELEELLREYNEEHGRYPFDL